MLYACCMCNRSARHDCRGVHLKEGPCVVSDVHDDLQQTNTLVRAWNALHSHITSIPHWASKRRACNCPHTVDFPSLTQQELGLTGISGCIRYSVQLDMDHEYASPIYMQPCLHSPPGRLQLSALRKHIGLQPPEAARLLAASWLPAAGRAVCDCLNRVFLQLKQQLARQCTPASWIRRCSTWSALNDPKDSGA